MLVNITPNLTQSFWQGLVAGFTKANPGVTVSIEAPSASGSIAATLTTTLAAGDAPDVVEGLPPSTTVAPELVDLSDQAWIKNTPMASVYTLNGKTYMAGVGSQVQSLIFYNETAFKDAGITTPPTTVDELTADMAKLKAAGWVPLQTAGEWVTGAQLSLLATPSVVGSDPSWYQDIDSKKTTFTKSYGAWVDTYKSWITSGYTPNQAVGIKYVDAQADFFAGKTAMYPMGSWVVAADATNKKNFTVGVFAAPATAGVTAPAMGANIADPYMIIKTTKHEAAALALIKYLTTNTAAVTSQLQTDGDFRTGFSYPTTPLGTAVENIVSASTALVPTGDGFGDNHTATGYAAQLDTDIQGLYIGKSAASVDSDIDNWLSSHPSS